MAAVKCQSYELPHQVGLQVARAWVGLKKKKTQPSPHGHFISDTGGAQPRLSALHTGPGLQVVSPESTKYRDKAWTHGVATQMSESLQSDPADSAPAHPELRMWHATEAVSISGWPSLDLDNCDNIWRAFYTFRALTYIIQVTLRFVTDQTRVQRTTAWSRPRSQQQRPDQNPGFRAR